MALVRNRLFLLVTNVLKMPALVGIRHPFGLRIAHGHRISIAPESHAHLVSGDAADGKQFGESSTVHRDEAQRGLRCEVRSSTIGATVS